MTVRFESMFVNLVKDDVMSFGAEAPKQFRAAKAVTQSLFKSSDRHCNVSWRQRLA